MNPIRRVPFFQQRRFHWVLAATTVIGGTASPSSFRPTPNIQPTAPTVPAQPIKRIVLNDNQPISLSDSVDERMILTYAKIPGREFMWPRHQSGHITAWVNRNAECKCPVYFEVARDAAKKITLEAKPLDLTGRMTLQAADFLGLEPLFAGERISPLILITANLRLPKGEPSLTMEMEGAVSFINASESLRMSKEEFEKVGTALAAMGSTQATQVLRRLVATLPASAAKFGSLVDIALETAHQRQLDMVPASLTGLKRNLAAGSKAEAIDPTSVHEAIELMAQLGVLESILQSNNPVERQARLIWEAVRTIGVDLVLPQQANPIVRSARFLSGAVVLRCTSRNAAGQFIVDEKKAEALVHAIAVICQNHLKSVDEDIVIPKIAALLGKSTAEFKATIAQEVQLAMRNKNLGARDAAFEVWGDLRYLITCETGPQGDQLIDDLAAQLDDTAKGAFQRQVLHGLGLSATTPDALRQELLAGFENQKTPPR